MAHLRPKADHPAGADGLTVGEIADVTGHSLRRVRRLFNRWRRAGYPRVWTEPSAHGEPRMLVDALEYEALQRGELSPHPISRAA